MVRWLPVVLLACAGVLETLDVRLTSADDAGHPPITAVDHDVGTGDLRVTEAAGAVGELTAAGVPRRDAARVVARLTGIPRNKLYRGSL